MKKSKYFFDWLIRMIVYGIILILMSTIFPKTIQIDTSLYGLWALLISIYIYILNKTLRPILVWITLPITGLTMGLFYPFINVIILNIADLLFKNHFTVQGIFMTCLVSLLIGLFNMIMDNVLLKGEKI